MTDISKLAIDGDVSPLFFDDNYLAAGAVSRLPLESADVDAIVARAQELAAEQHLLLPDAETLLERCVIALLGGHLVLQGPPGTGKTTLAYVLAEAFNAAAHLETATADWSTYDVIGGLHPSSTPMGTEALVPWLGHVPRAALECASVIARHADEDEDEPHQAHWLIIDEFSRAEIDKAIGPLYTVLGGGHHEPLPLWFGASEETKAVYLPKRFRIIGTMNSVDTNYVYTFSQGLSRRFQFVYVGVPERGQVAAELEQARHNAGTWYLDMYGGDNFDVDAFVADERVERATVVLADFVSAVRYDDANTGQGGWPLGTAQLVDVYRQLALRLPAQSAEADALLPALDLALADRVIPQAGNLGKALLDRAEAWLTAQDSPRALEALRHLRTAAATGY